MRRRSRPTPLIWISAGMLAIPAALMLIASLALLLQLAGMGPPLGIASGPAVLGAFLFPIPAALWLYAEYRAVIRASAKVAGLIVGLCLYLTALASMGWCFKLLYLTGLLHGEPGRATWPEFVEVSIVLACLAFAGYGHWSWRRTILAQQKEKFADDELA